MHSALCTLTRVGLLEMDNEVGRVIAAVNSTGNSEKTLIVVTGDNGPWECKCNLAGSKGEGKP